MAKAPAKAAPAHGEAAPAGKSKKKLIIIIAAAVLVLAGVGGGAAFFLSKKHSGSKDEYGNVFCKYVLGMCRPAACRCSGEGRRSP